jgi:hypothetical protein
MNCTLIEKIVGGLAAVEETEPEHMDIVVQDWIESDAIRQLAAHGRESWELQFAVETYDVRVRGDETVFIDGEERQPAIDSRY